MKHLNKNINCGKILRPLIDYQHEINAKHKWYQWVHRVYNQWVHRVYTHDNKQFALHVIFKCVCGKI